MNNPDDKAQPRRGTEGRSTTPTAKKIERPLIPASTDTFLREDLLSSAESSSTGIFLKDDLARAESGKVSSDWESDDGEESVDPILSAYTDFDIQLAELKGLIERNTRRWRIQENFFYGLVILLLLVNMGMLVWIAAH